jgi:hypothetical protein
MCFYWEPIENLGEHNKHHLALGGNLKRAYGTNWGTPKSHWSPPPSLAKGKIEPLMVHVVSPQLMRRIFNYLEPFGIFFFEMEYFLN